jgi:protein-S-isoprenylcysteine O-methyltransferase Ste14
MQRTRRVLLKCPGLPRMSSRAARDGFRTFPCFFDRTVTMALPIEVFEGQQVISIGPYAVVRHPMYAWVLVMCFGAELALGSWWGLLVIVAMQVPVLVWRILDEERLLQRDLPGYGDYMRKVRYRLVPHVW